MIDLVATRNTTDTQTAACARLLTAVITQAVRDACKPMNAKEKAAQRNLDGDARTAISFLFGTDSVFPLYANLIGSSAESIRFALLNKPQDVSPLGSRLFTDMDRRVLGGRMRWREASSQVHIPHAN
jgi:hypothetical protein